ncbi:acetylxylan esterase [Parvularcula flava]|nr:acetylxylan esterase [Aquisalinus luteolus]
MAQNEAPVELTAEEDHRRMLDLLGLEALRPGRNGMDPEAENYANYDEATSNPYPDLPPLMITENGEPVTGPQMWEETRRPELVGIFSEEIYGHAPAVTPSVTWEVVAEREETVAGVPAIVRDYVGRVDNSAYPAIEVNIDMTLTLPAEAEGPVPAIVSFIFRFPANWEAPAGWEPPSPSATERILSRGWAHAELVPTTVQADNGAGLTKGIIGLVNKGQPRDADDWGALRAWAWGASRVLDEFEGMKEIDETRVAIEGLSRYGKAALVTMAYDERFAAGFSGSSGEAGASLYRRDNGEVLENVASSGEYHWMGGNFLKYAADPLGWDDLPIDAHSLIALSAPRPLFVGTGKSEEGDAWVDPVGIFMATKAASPAWELYGAGSIHDVDFPGEKVEVGEGAIVFRQQEGGHSNHLNWESFLDFAKREWADE